MLVTTKIQPLTTTGQFEALIQFLLGRFHVDMTYDDSLLSIARHNLTSLGGFWCAAANSARLGVRGKERREGSPGASSKGQGA